MTEAAAALADGASVIVDAVHLRLEERTALEQLAATLGVRFSGVWLEAPKATLVERVNRRGADVSDATVAVVGMQSNHETGDIFWQRVPATDDPRTLAAKVLDLVDADRSSTGSRNPNEKSVRPERSEA